MVFIREINRFDLLVWIVASDKHESNTTTVALWTRKPSLSGFPHVLNR
jgi:hypothetical protein